LIILTLAIFPSIFTSSAIAQLANTPWPMFRHDPYHTGRSQYIGPQIIDFKWKAKYSGTLALGPEGTLYVGSGTDLYAINPVDGTLKWKTFIDYYVISVPAIASDGSIYVGAGDFLYAVTSNGDIKWRHQLGRGHYTGSSPAIASDGTIYILRNYELHAVNPDGTLRWKVDTEIHCSSSPAIGPDGTVYITTIDRWENDNYYLYAISPYGEIKWKILLGTHRPPELGHMPSPVIADDGAIYVAGADIEDAKYLCAINPNGSLKWQINLGYHSGDLALGPDGTVYTVTYDDECLCAISPNGTLKWKVKVGWWPSKITIGADGTIYVDACTKNPNENVWDCTLYAVDRDGNIKWSYFTDSSCEDVVIGSNETLYVACNYLYALGGTATLAADFTADKTEGVKPLTVQFTDQSTGEITSWYWEFGDGETSTEQNPIHTYNSTGYFTVSLTVTGPGGSDTETKENYIHVTEVDKDKELAIYWSPVIYQQTDITGENGLGGRADYITKFDFDNDFKGDNNWENAEKYPLKAYVYYDVKETKTHWFIFYALYHPRDWEDWHAYLLELAEKLPCAPSGGAPQHENDMEGMLFVVRKDGSKHGKLEIIESLAHDYWLNYPDPLNLGLQIQLKENFFNDTDNRVATEIFNHGIHPIAYVQARGHAIFLIRIQV